MKGRLIFFTGLDGSGKTTQAHRLLEDQALRQAGWVYRWARWEPWLTSPSMRLARWLLLRRRGGGSSRPTDDSGHEDFKSAKQGLFRRRWLRSLWTTIVLLEYLPQMAWRLLPPLLAGRTVICDRYLPDVWIDLSMNYGEGVPGVQRLQRHPLSRVFPRPELTVLFRVDAETGYTRKQDGTPLGYLRDREPLYESLPQLLPAIVIDANQPVEEVSRRLRDALREERVAFVESENR